MANNIVEIIIKANNQTGSTFSKLNTGFKELTGFSLGAAGGVALAGAAIKGIYGFIDDAVNVTEKYNTTMMDLARITGSGVEEMSRLTQVADDLFISQEELTQALSIGAKKGIDVSVNGIKSLAQEYSALKTPQEQAALLNEKFGRSGLVMGKLLDQSKGSIEEAMAAVSSSLVVTEESIQKTIAYKQQVDELNDTWLGFKITVGSEVIPALTDLLNGLQGNSDWFKEQLPEMNQKVGALGVAGGMSADQIARLKEQLGETKAPTNELVDPTSILAGAYGELATEMLPVTEYFKELTKQMIYAKAAEGLNAEDSYALAEAMGLIDKNTQYAYDKIDSYRELLSDTGNLEAYTGLVVDLADQWEYFQGLQDINKNITIFHNDIYSSSYSKSSPGYFKSSSLEQRAGGGAVYANTPYLVGERGPEVIVPNSNGYVVPNNKIGSANTPVQQPGLTQSDMLLALGQFSRQISNDIVTAINQRMPV